MNGREPERHADPYEERSDPAASRVAAHDHGHGDGEEQPLRDRHIGDLAERRLESFVEYVRSVVRCQQGEHQPCGNDERARATGRHPPIVAGFSLGLVRRQVPRARG